MKLEGRVAVVTGAASGIGRGMVEAFLDRGMRVVLADVEQTALEHTVDELDRGDAVFAVRTDVTVEDEVESLAARAFDHFGAVHVVCNNAGVNINGRAWELTAQDWKWVIDVNLWGVIHGVRAFVPRMLAQSEGHIVNTSSMMGVATTASLAPYLASKHGVAALSEGLAQELRSADSDVRVSVLCPGFVRTRILESARNRPDHHEQDVDETSAAVASMIEKGLDPRIVGDQVARAIEAKQFWIFTEPDMFPMVESRFERMKRDVAVTSA